MQGGTGLALITGTEDCQHAYVALTRGTDVNTAYVFILPSERHSTPRQTGGEQTSPGTVRFVRIFRLAAPTGILM